MLFATPSVILGLATLGSSHMIMNTPVPYGKSSLNNSPLDHQGADFPCKQRAGVYDAEGASNSMALGSTQPLKFTGSATHGGGSCQISVTYDKAPTKSSVFKVIHSIVGGCPIQGVAGNNGDSASAVDPSTYSFKIPSTLPTGDATLAWTWFNKVGNREMYMNCAPITITAGSSKRDDEDLETRNVTQLMERDQAAFNALPDMFVANINGDSGCGTAQSKDLQFPSPGDSVETLAGSTTQDLGGPTNCGAVASATGGSGSGATTAAGSAITSAAKASSVPASSPALSGGVFATVASSAIASSAPQVSTSSAASPVASSAPASQASSAASPASTGTTGTGSAIAAGTACTTDGMWNCIGGTSFQQCASGVWSAVQPVAGGTTCTAGQSTSFSVNAIVAKRVKRSVRFSQDHVRRRFNPENFHA